MTPEALRQLQLEGMLYNQNMWQNWEEGEQLEGLHPLGRWTMSTHMLQGLKYIEMQRENLTFMQIEDVAARLRIPARRQLQCYHPRVKKEGNLSYHGSKCIRCWARLRY